MKTGDKFKVVNDMVNPVSKLKLTIGSSIRNPSGNAVIPLNIGDIMEYVDDNGWDASFWKINGLSGKFNCLPEHLINKNILPINE